MSSRFAKVQARLSAVAFIPVVVYCAALGRRALHSHFSNDDPMNMGWAWRDGFWFLLWHNVTFWSTAYRPMGQLYYLSIFRIFGLDPLPYRFVIIAIVVMNAYLSCTLAQLLTGSRATGFLTGMLAGAHGSMVDIYYQNDIIYDVLAYCFSMLVLIRYIGIRRRNELPDNRETTIIVCLFIAALNSKEISAPLAGFVLAYELLFHGWPSGIKASMAWLKREGRLSLIFFLLVAVYTAGKLLGPNSLTEVATYTIHLSWRLYVANNAHGLNDLFYTSAINGPMFLVISGILLLVLVVLKKSPAVRWCCFYILTVTLPISFIRQRGGSALYLPLFGWALLAGIVLVKLVDILSSALRWPRLKIPAASVRPALLIFLAYGIVSMTLYSWKGKGTGQILSQEPTWSVMSQLRSFPFRPRPGSSVLFLDDPFTDWRMYFIAQLVWDDHW